MLATWSLALILISLALWIFGKPHGLPPGKWGLPFIGYIPLYTMNVGTVIDDLRKKYGDIFTWKLGSQVVVGFCDYNVIKDVFNRPQCQGRADLFTWDVLKIHTNTGVIGSVGDPWVQGRRFALRHLKDFGMGKSSMESVIQREALDLADNFGKSAGKPTEISLSLNAAVTNVIWRLVADQRFDIHDPKIMRFNALIKSNADTMQSRLAILDLFPQLYRFLPKVVVNKVLGAQVMYQNMKELRAFFLETIKDHEETLNPDDPRDYIDTYLIEIRKERGTDDTIFKDDYVNLMTSVFDLFAAGSDTTSSTLRWLLALMANHPEIQKKMQEEIDSVVPRDRPPSLQDKHQLPYTEAVLYEVMRYATFIPMALWHATTEDIQIGGYNIPKGTAIFPSIRSCHRDPKYFEKPNEFYPEHFLKDGKVLSKKEGFCPFSVGRRQCLGENLARMELFLFSSYIFQRFTVSPPKGKKVPLDTDPFQPFLSYILPYEIVFTDRE